MGVNIFCIATHTDDLFVEQLVNEVNEKFGCNEDHGGHEDNDDPYFDWCNLYAGTDAKSVMTVDEAKAFDESDGPWYVIDARDAVADDPASSELSIIHTSNGEISVREKWLPLLELPRANYVIFLKARG